MEHHLVLTLLGYQEVKPLEHPVCLPELEVACELLPSLIICLFLLAKPVAHKEDWVVQIDLVKTELSVLRLTGYQLHRNLNTWAVEYSNERNHYLRRGWNFRIMLAASQLLGHLQKKPQVAYQKVNLSTQTRSKPQVLGEWR